MRIKQTLIIFIKKIIFLIMFNRERKNLDREIEKSFKNITPIQKNIPLNIKLYKKKWSQLSSKVNTMCYKTYTYLSGKESINYVPYDIYYMLIEPRLNRIDMKKVYSDKNMYEKYNSDIKNIFPTAIIRNIENIFYDESYNKIYNIEDKLNTIKQKRIVVKPSIDSGSGRNIRFFSKNNGSYLTNKGIELNLAFLNKHYKKNYIIQAYIKQHSYFAAFNLSSLNTIRITTYRSVLNEEVNILHSKLRMGGKNSQVDNIGAGGTAVYIFPDGSLQVYASDKLGRRFYQTPASGIKFSQIGSVPHWDQICKTAVKIAETYFYFRIIGFDFTLQEDGGIKLVEINLANLEISFQVDSGPYLGKYTDEIIKFCLRPDLSTQDRFLKRV